MKKIVLVLGLVMGSFVFSDAIAAVSTKSNVAIENHDTPLKKKKKAKKSCCASKSEASATKSCSKEKSSCCSKKKTETTPSK